MARHARTFVPWQVQLAAAVATTTAASPAYTTHGAISVDPNSTAIARMPTTHAGLIMEGVNHALYGYGLGSQMLFGEGFEEPSVTDCTADKAACYGPFPEQWSVIGGNASLTSTKAEVFSGKQSLRIDGAAQLLNAGLHRLGIASTQGWAYDASFFYQYKSDPPTDLYHWSSERFSAAWKATISVLVAKGRARVGVAASAADWSKRIRDLQFLDHEGYATAT